MLHDLIASASRPREYRRFAAEKGSRAASYIAFLSILFIGALAVSLKFRMAPLFNETFAWLEQSMPPLRFADGRVASDVHGPRRLEHPRYHEMALMIDTDRVEPATPKMLKDAKVSAYLTSNALYLPGLDPDKLEMLDFSKASSAHAVILNAASYREMRKNFDWVFYPAILLLFFLLFALSLAFFGLIYGLIGLLMVPRRTAAALGYPSLFRLAVHAQTPAALLRMLDQLLPVSIPYLVVIAPMLSLVMLWLGVRAAAGTEPPSAA